jgi:hypothetical protein
MVRYQPEKNKSKEVALNELRIAMFGDQRWTVSQLKHAICLDYLIIYFYYS